VSWNPDASPRALLDAAEALDRPRVAALSAELITHVRSRDAPYPSLAAQTILQTLRRKRHLQQLQQVADAFLQTGCDGPTVRRQYAQALLDQGALEAAVAVLRDLLAETADGGSEGAEARGLLGRAYKQMYVATASTAPEARRRFLERAIAAYAEVYEQSHQRWHGINTVALLERARRDEINLPGLGVEDPGAAARAKAQEILDAIHDLGDRAGAWDHGTAMEACIALGLHDEALEQLDDYLATDADAFELSGTLRQLQEVWELDPATQPGSRLIPVLQGALLAREGTAEVAVGATELVPATLEKIDRDPGFERILGTERFQSLRWFRTALERCRSIARIEDPLGRSRGTGFLVEGAILHRTFPPLVLVTNAHVVSADDWKALSPEHVRVSFRALAGAEQPQRVVRLLWSSRHELDTTVLELDGCPEDAAPCPVAPGRPPLQSDSPPQTYIIGHPSGDDEVMLSVRDNLLLDADDLRVHYRTPTEVGSSGSPVFNQWWELIAVHHTGTMQMARLNGREGTYPANEGIWIDRVAGALADALG
jgi:tetratricopeptide (TPR) repeat protein